jgi:hypothetical protein
VTAALPEAEPAGGFDPVAAAARVAAAMAPLADAGHAVQAKAYLKSDLDFLGVSVPGIRQAVTAEARGWPKLGRAGVLAWAQVLWDAPVYERYATPMLTEQEFFIRKVIGWVLRETSKREPAYVAAWTGAHLDRMSGVTFREAVRRLPEAQAAPLRDAYRRG